MLIFGESSRHTGSDFIIFNASVITCSTSSSPIFTSLECDFSFAFINLFIKSLRALPELFIKKYFTYMLLFSTI